MLGLFVKWQGWRRDLRIVTWPRARWREKEAGLRSALAPAVAQLSRQRRGHRREWAISCATIKLRDDNHMVFRKLSCQLIS